MPSDLTINRVFRVLLRQHTHGLPLCRTRTHSPSCKVHGREISCVRIITGHNKATGKLKYGAFCTHLYY
jgi:hypothetical protein